DGHERTSEFLADADTSGSKNAIQARGSAVSYGHRYTTKDLLNITTREAADDASYGLSRLARQTAAGRAGGHAGARARLDGVRARLEAASAPHEPRALARVQGDRRPAGVMSLTLVPTAPAFTVVDAPQRSPEWFAARLGRLTGSRAGDMMATIKSGEAASRRDLRLQLVLERLTGTVQDDGYVSADMRRGIAREPAALAAYEVATGHLVQTTGFLQHDTLPAGCSLDGHV